MIFRFLVQLLVLIAVDNVPVQHVRDSGVSVYICEYGDPDNRVYYTSVNTPCCFYDYHSSYGWIVVRTSKGVFLCNGKKAVYYHTDNVIVVRY